MANSLSALTSSITGALGLLLVSPQDVVGYQPDPSATAANPNEAGPLPPSFVFHYEGENTVSLESDITDHPVEDNTSIQDQIGLAPALITTQGFIGELNDILDLPSGAVSSIATTAISKLSPLAQYAPGLSVAAQNAYNEAFFAYQIALSAKNTAVSAWSSINGDSGESVIGNNGLSPERNQNKQQTAFQMFFGYRAQRVLFTIQTPWAIFENCAIKSLKATQSADTNSISEFGITFKQLRFAQVLQNAGPYSNPNNFSTRLSQQSSPATNLGTSGLAPSPNSFSSGVSSLK